jgi:hypothetical protein
VTAVTVYLSDTARRAKDFSIGQSQSTSFSNNGLNLMETLDWLAEYQIDVIDPATS